VFHGIRDVPATCDTPQKGDLSMYVCSRKKVTRRSAATFLRIRPRFVRTVPRYCSKNYPEKGTNRGQTSSLFAFIVEDYFFQPSVVSLEQSQKQQQQQQKQKQQRLEAARHGSNGPSEWHA
jgi:hypothetical protein